MSKQQNQPFWQVIKAKSEKKAELLIYGEISSFAFWGDEVTPKEVNDILNAIGNVDELSVRINSPGGEVFAGMAIYSMLKRHPANVTAYIDGLAASIASVIPLAANKIVMMRGGMYMIHRPWGGVRQATSDKLRAQADLLDKIEGEMTALYSGKSGMTAEQIGPLLAAETWYTADEAKTAGFIDEIEGDSVIAASLRDDSTAIINGVEMNWRQFANAPPLPKVESPPAEDHSYKIAAQMRELEMKKREV
ncbi:MAG: Clp protease ClpP [Cohnella sp.]|nr:Clp protease ClpP [Cohnella sp.]